MCVFFICYLLLRSFHSSSLFPYFSTPLHFAARKGNLRQFRKNGIGLNIISVSLKNKLASTCETFLKPFPLKKWCSQLCIIRIRSSESKWSIYLYETICSMQFWVCVGYTNLAKLLIDHEANVNAKDSRGTTPLHWTAQYGKSLDLRRVIGRRLNICLPRIFRGKRNEKVEMDILLVYQ